MIFQFLLILGINSSKANKQNDVFNADDFQFKMTALQSEENFRLGPITIKNLVEKDKKYFLCSPEEKKISTNKKKMNDVIMKEICKRSGFLHLFAFSYKSRKIRNCYKLILRNQRFSLQKLKNTNILVLKCFLLNKTCRFD